MTFIDEEARAAAWRAQAERRVANRHQQEATLTGNPTARVALGQRWAGFLEWLAERREKATAPIGEGDVW